MGKNCVYRLVSDVHTINPTTNTECLTGGTVYMRLRQFISKIEPVNFASPLHSVFVLMEVGG